MRLPTALAALVLGFAPAHALDSVLGAPRLDGAGNLRLPGGPTLGTWVGGVYSATPQRLVLPDADQGSKGSVNGFSVVPNGLTTPRTLADRLADLPIAPEDFPGLYVGSDATAAFQAAINAGLAQNRAVLCKGDYRVRQVVVPTGGLRLRGDACRLLGEATTPTSSVLEVKAGVLTVDGRVEVSAQYKTNYDAAVWWHVNGQGSQVSNLSATQAKLCWRIGSADAPSALMSEMTILGGHSYGCTQTAEFNGVETYVHVIGAQWGSDDLGAPSANWAGIEHKGITTRGADVTMTGGELVMAGIVDGVLIDNQPFMNAAGTTVQWGRVRLLGVTAETASPLARSSNPSGLTINANNGTRGLLSFNGVGGYHSQDRAPFIATTADYEGDVIWQNGGTWFIGAMRTFANVSAGSIKTDVYVDDIGFGRGFRPALSGTEGGTVHFSSRLIQTVVNLGGQSFAQGNTTAKFLNQNGAGDRALYYAAYNPSTGVFTVPPGGLKELQISATITAAGTGTLYVNRNDGAGGGQVALAPLANGSGSILYDAVDVPAGAQISILIAANAATAAGSPDYFNTLRIRARN